MIQSALLCVFMFLMPVRSTIGEEERRNITHLNVRVGEIINLTSQCIKNDNSSNEKFYYDYSGPEVKAIPAGYSFVVTDIIVNPNCNVEPFNSSSTFTLAVIGTNPGGSRIFEAQFAGPDAKTYSLTGGLAYRSGSVLTPRNTTFSTSYIVIQVLGYFVRGEAVKENTSRF